MTLEYAVLSIWPRDDIDRYCFFDTCISILGFLGLSPEEILAIFGEIAYISQMVVTQKAIVSDLDIFGIVWRKKRLKFMMNGIL